MAKKYLDLDGLKVYHTNVIEALNKKADASDVYTKSEADALHKNITDTLDGKLDKKTNTTSNHQVYGKNNNGVQAMFNISDKSTAYYIAQRGPTGKFEVGSTEETDKPNTVVSKDYVDAVKTDVSDIYSTLEEQELLVEQHEINEMFYQRMTASDKTGSKYEIEDGSLAQINKLGGMTYKSENLLNSPKYTATLSGLSTTIEGSVVKVSGTPTSQWIGFGSIRKIITLPKGDYIMKVYGLPDGYGYRMMDVTKPSDYALQQNTPVHIDHEMTLTGILNVPPDIINTESINLEFRISIMRTENYTRFTPVSNETYTVDDNSITVHNLTNDSTNPISIVSKTIAVPAGTYTLFIHNMFESQPTSSEIRYSITGSVGGSISSGNLIEYKNYQQGNSRSFTVKVSNETITISFYIVGNNLVNWNARIMLFNTDVKSYTGKYVYTEYFENGLRNTKVTGVKSVGNNLLNNNLLDSYDGSATKQTDNSFISKALENYGAIILNGKYQSTFGEVRSFNGIELSKGTYYISFKVKLNSGTASNINTVFITRENSTQINTTSVYKPTAITNDYQTYKRSFELTENDKIGITIQVPNGVSNVIIQVKDIMISKDDVEYQPYWEDIVAIPETITNLPGYDIGINNTYHNYVDFKRSMFIENVKETELDLTQPHNVQLDNTNFIVDVIYHIADMTQLSAGNNIVCNKITVGGKKRGELRTRSNYLNYLYVFVPYEFLTSTPTTKEEAKTLVLEYFNSTGLTSATYIYPLATPIETPIEIPDMVYKVDNIGTETLVNEYGYEAPASITYGVSLKKQIIENSDNISKIKTSLEEIQNGATNDSEGNNIVDTYEKKGQLRSGTSLNNSGQTAYLPLIDSNLNYQGSTLVQLVSQLGSPSYYDAFKVTFGTSNGGATLGTSSAKMNISGNAESATNDSNGNKIVDTYAVKTHTHDEYSITVENYL